MSEKNLSDQNEQPDSVTQSRVTEMASYRDVAGLLSPGSRRQSLRGFDEDYVDIVDYIIRGTYKIWEEKGLGRIYDHYRHNVIIHTSDGTTYGRDKVIADSTKTMAAFPDLRLYGDEVIWSGNDEDGFHTSHRITWVGHNTGYSIYGPPTGRKVVRRGIAHCFVKENRIVEEWISRDELALIRQLGFDENELARKMAPKDTGPEQPMGEVERLRGQDTPEPVPPEPSGDFDPEYFIRRSFHEIWNWRLLNKIDDYYVKNYLCYASNDRKIEGLGDFKAFILSLLAAFPDAALTVDHFACVGNENDGYRAATRWTLQGTHEGPGIYGEPTGKRIHLLGITHHEIKDGKFVREWTVFDEFALLKQLVAGQAPEPEATG